MSTASATNFMYVPLQAAELILVVKYRLGRALVQLASDTVMFLGIMHSAANQGVRELAATML